MQVETPFYEVSDSIVEAGGSDMLKCYQCGTCTAVCPWNLTASMETRRMLHLQQVGLGGYEDDALWRCVTCLRCAEACPRGVGITDVVAAARSLMYGIGSIPKPLSAALGSIRAAGNPWQGERRQREAWMEKTGLMAYEAGHRFFIFPCCTNIYEEEAREAFLAFARILRAAGVEAGLPASGGVCCGDLAVRNGARDVFDGLKADLQRMFEEHANPHAVVLSPHCLVALARSAGVRSMLSHYTQILSSLLDEGRIKIGRRIEAKITYHDPCYLGRWSGIYDEPRKILNAMAGSAFVEMERNKSAAVCCGGGGGGAFSDVPAKERLGLLRARQAEETGAEIVATACPFCAVMLRDGVLAAGLEGKIAVSDIARLLLDAIDT